MAYLSLGIANKFIAKAEEQDRGLTAMQLQKLCYLSHGFTLALLDHALTSDKPEAWDYGPVYPQLYDATKRFGSSPIPQFICQNNWSTDPLRRGPIVRAHLTNEEQQLIDTVWADYGAFEAFQLSALTHEEDSPWAKVYQPGRKSLKISDSEIKDYFVRLANTVAAQPA